MARRAAVAHLTVAHSLALLLISGVAAYDQGEDVSLCWQTNGTAEPSREDCNGQDMQFTGELPERFIEHTNYTFKYSLTLPKWADPVAHGMSTGSSEQFELPHANIHSCERKVGFCTPFVKNTPGLATHTVAQQRSQVAERGVARTLEFTSVVTLEAGQYTIIAHGERRATRTPPPLPLLLTTPSVRMPNYCTVAIRRSLLVRGRRRASRRRARTFRRL